MRTNHEKVNRKARVLVRRLLIAIIHRMMVAWMKVRIVMLVWRHGSSGTVPA
jgi:hypothetical protein